MLAKPTGNDEWHTPPELLRAARHVMGGIDCDPASNEIAQRLVQARVWYDKGDDGLRQPWHGRVWLNPREVIEAEHRLHERERERMRLVLGAA